MGKIFQLINLLLLIKLTISKTNVDDNLIDSDFIECYWCNSRDTYCGKRVTDTMVTTIKCPRHSHCAVYTNPYDNFYLHRGCTYGMDLGDVEIENGCFVEEDGSTYCFCDFNRCNAAGIIDLRNLIDEKNETFKSFKLLTKHHSNSKENDEPQYNPNHFKNLKQDLKMNSSKLISYFTLPSLFSSSYIPKPQHQSYLQQPRQPLQQQQLRLKQDIVSLNKTETTNLPFQATNLDKLLKTIFGSSQSISSNMIKEKIRNSSNPEKLLKKFEKYSQEILSSNQNINRLKNLTKEAALKAAADKLRMATSGTPSQSKILITTQRNIQDYQTKPKPINAYTTSMNNKAPFPSLYKLNINDSFSKTIIDSVEFRSRFGLKPKEKLSLLLLKKPSENGQQKMDFLINNKVLYPIKNTTTRPVVILPQSPSVKPNYFLTLPSANNDSWLSKLKAKLSSAPSYLNNIYNWNHVLTDQYRQGLYNIQFKCPRDGLFNHPTNCSQFIQCVYHGTLHERFYILNCPSGLYFNLKLEMCDYQQNVKCFYNK